MVRRSAGRGLVAAALVLSGCPVNVPGLDAGILFPCPDGNCPPGQLCGGDGNCHAPAASGSTSGGSSVGGSTSSSSTSTGSSASSGSGSSGSTSSGSTTTITSSSSSGIATCAFTVTGSSSGGSSGGQSGFAGEWDTDWAQVYLQEDAGVVTGTYVQWGWGGNTDNSGWIAGTVTNSSFSGSFNDWAQSMGAFGGGVPGLVDWTLDSTGTSFTGNDKGGANVWCGARSGLPLPPGCGWSGTFQTSNWGAVTLTQLADEVQGFALTSCTGVAGTVYNGPLGLTCDGLILSTSGPQSRFSWALDSATERLFSGNELPSGGTAPTASCGDRQSAGVSLPAPCFGGGGPMDGMWATNLGALTIDQPIAITAPYAEQYTSVNWVPWGTDGGYGAQYATIDGVTKGLSYALMVSGGLSWSDGSKTLGATGLRVSFDGGLTISGTGNDPALSLLCGAIYAPDPFGNYADPIGNLQVGCGMTNRWFLWGPTTPQKLSTAPLTQHRDQVSGLGGAASARAFASDGGSGVYFVGSADGVPFNWFPNAQDFQFSGDNGADAGWCGSTISSFMTSEPIPCFE